MKMFCVRGASRALRANHEIPPLRGFCSAAGHESLTKGHEIRLRGGSLSADRIKADYDMIVNRNFLRYGPVDNGKGEAE